MNIVQADLDRKNALLEELEGQRAQTKKQDKKKMKKGSKCEAPEGEVKPMGKKNKKKDESESDSSDSDSSDSDSDSDSSDEGEGTCAKGMEGAAPAALEVPMASEEGAVRKGKGEGGACCDDSSDSDSSDSSSSESDSDCE